MSLKNALSDLYRPVYRFFRKIERMLFWGWNMRNNHDWDYVYFLETIHLKLKRMEKEMVLNGHAAWQSNPKSKQLRTLREAILLSEKLMKNDDSFLAKASFGMPQISIEKMSKNKDLVRKLTAAYKNDLDVEKARTDRLYYLMARYGRLWWD